MRLRQLRQRRLTTTRFRSKRKDGTIESIERDSLKGGRDALPLQFQDSGGRTWNRGEVKGAIKTQGDITGDGANSKITPAFIESTKVKISKARMAKKIAGLDLKKKGKFLEMIKASGVTMTGDEQELMATQMETNAQDVIDEANHNLEVWRREYGHDLRFGLNPQKKSVEQPKSNVPEQVQYSADKKGWMDQQIAKWNKTAPLTDKEKLMNTKTTRDDPAFRKINKQRARDKANTKRRTSYTEKPPGPIYQR